MNKCLFSEEKNIDDICDDDSGEINELCNVYYEFGKSEMLFRCGIRVCKKWAHKECISRDNYLTYICDFCQ